MNNIEQFKQFTKNPTNEKFSLRGGDAVIYHRVSSVKQMNNTSLAVQKKYCQDFADDRKLNVVKVFGGTHESAKSDERKEFQKMLSYVKKKKTVGYILVYMYDRFSRTGVNSITITDNLMNEYGIRTVSVTQEVDTTTPEGEMQQGMNLLFSHYDNQSKKKRTIILMTEKLKKGYWLNQAPYGYTNLNPKTRAEEHEYAVNGQGELLKKAFNWLANGMSLIKAWRKIDALGFNKPYKTFCNLICNPFYCGLIVHSFIPGEVVEGRHPPLISKETFLKVHAMKNTASGYHIKKDNEEIPLTQMMKCSDCGTSYAGYRAVKKLKTKSSFFFYYKCTKIGCKKNKNVEKVHETFLQFLQQFRVSEHYIPVIKHAMVETFSRLNKDNVVHEKTLKSRLTQVETKIETVEEKLILSDLNDTTIDLASLNKFHSKYVEEKRHIEAELEQYQFDFSNLEKCIDLALKFYGHLRETWESKGIETKKRLQNMLFPEGIIYDFHNDTFRTNRTNSIFALIPLLSVDSAQKKRGQFTSLNELSPLAPPLGLELRLL